MILTFKECMVILENLILCHKSQAVKILIKLLSKQKNPEPQIFAVKTEFIVLLLLGKNWRFWTLFFEKPKIKNRNKKR